MLVKVGPSIHSRVNIYLDTQDIKYQVMMEIQTFEIAVKVHRDRWVDHDTIKHF